jgi:sugar O-acyltransferase (sialic acid O-acetyltransferase NeuD family)
VNPLVIVGCGGFGREVFSIVDALNADGAGWTVAGFVDDAPTVAAKEAVDALGSQILGDLASLAARRGTTSVVLAVGSPTARTAIWRRLRGDRIDFPVLVHPDATLGRNVDLAEGVVVAPGARLSTAIRIGSHVHVDQNVTVGHDTRVGSFARLNPQACLSGSVVIGERVLVGAGATVLQGLSVAEDAVVGAAACVVRDVPPSTTVKGVPAR